MTFRVRSKQNTARSECVCRECVCVCSACSTECVCRESCSACAGGVVGVGGSRMAESAGMQGKVRECGGRGGCGGSDVVRTFALRFTPTEHAAKHSAHAVLRRLTNCVECAIMGGGMKGKAKRCECIRSTATASANTRTAQCTQGVASANTE